MFNIIIRTACTALLLSLAACGGGGGGGGSTPTPTPTPTPVPNSPPSITEGTSTNISMSVNGAPNAFASFTLNATDTDGDTLSWSLSTGAAHGTATITGTGNSRNIGYVPAKDYAGSDKFIVQVSDGRGGIATYTVNVTVNDDASPVISDAKPASVNMTVNGIPTAFSLTLNATDANNETLTWSILTQSANGGTASVPAAPGNTGTSMSISYTNPNYVGSDSFVVQVADANGLTDTITVNVSVSNDAPVITQGTSTSVDMSQNGTPTAFSLTLDATDANSDTLTWSILTQSANGGTASVPAAPNNTGASMPISYTNPDYIGTDSFVVQVSDGHTTDTITVNLTIRTTNQVAISVDGGPLAPGNPTYNRPFVSVKICDASATNCQTIDHIVLDTGAVGLRVMASALSPTMLAALPTYQDTFSTINAGGPSNKNIGECYQLVSGYLWGSLRTAKVQIGGEVTTSSIPIEVIGDTTAGLAPSACTGTGADLGSQTALLANGILGVQYFEADCPTSCTSASNNVYFVCTDPANSATCSAIDVPVANQVPNPVFSFGDNGSGVSSDNNGLTVSLPTIPLTGALNTQGTLTFGVNTQPNNQLGSATILSVTNKGFLPTVFDGTTLCNSAIDSGSNNYSVPFVSGVTPPLCTSLGNTDFYCPTTGTYPNFPATTIQDKSQTTTVAADFYIANTDYLDGNNTAFNDVANDLTPSFATKDAGCTGTTGSFVWGLPFFFGKAVTTVFNNKTDGTNPGPYVSFKAN